jgi:hypothetical protein
MKLSKLKTRRKLSVWLLFATVIPFALYANLRVFIKELERVHGSGRFEEVVYEARLAPLIAMLPKDAIVGFVSTDDITKDAQHNKWFYLARYDLCPLILTHGTNYPFVIGAYYDVSVRGGPETAGLALVKDFGLVKEFGYGIRLYRGSPE